MLATLDSWLESIGERINPILVKETRQALKSRQFSVTFLLLLAASLVVSFGGVALSGPGLSYRSAGATFFIAYFVVLAFAVFVIVPFGAYRSLAAEQEERTFELISITKLKPRQIVAGKLLSAIIQMLIYYSAIGPCMTFTLLLKGIDAPSILFVLCLSAVASIGLAMGGLTLASMARRRGWHVFLSVALITMLTLGMLFSITIAIAIIQIVSPQMRLLEFWMGMATGLTAFITYFALVFQLSAAQLTFEADNRSTRVRLTLMIQFVLMLGWIGYWWIGYGHGDLFILIGVSIPVGVHWFLVGSILVSEHEGLSQRVAREVPRSLWRQTLVSLLLPGPARGFAFLLVNLTCMVAMAGLAEWTLDWIWTTPPAVKPVKHYATIFVLSLVSYITVYCGLGRVLIGLIRQRWPLPTPVGAAIVWLLAALGSAVPSFFAMVLPGHQFQKYSIWQITDPIATLVEIYQMSQFNSLALIPAGLAMLVVLLNLRGMTQAVGEISSASLRASPPRRAPSPIVFEGRELG
jgi:hypothetical protein